MSAGVIQTLNQGKLIAYPTEAVFGLGCDPDNERAVKSLLDLKKRPMSKGLILIASSTEQLSPYVDFSQLNPEQSQRVMDSWPGPHTWVLPKTERVRSWLSGQFDTLAVRVSAHPVVRSLCDEYGKPIVSTSANLSGDEPCRMVEEVSQKLGEWLGFIVEGECDPDANPSEIRDARTNQILRKG